MKKLLSPFLSVVALTFSTNAHSTPLSTADAKKVEPYSIIERGPDHRIWQRVISETNAFGIVRKMTNAYTELETGMHYRKDGKWLESEAAIEITPAGATANKGRHAVNFAPNINTVGAIDLTTPDQKRLRSHVLGLSYFDTATGQSALIAEIKDSVGELLPPNQVIYPDAFTDVKADIRYTYSKHGFEQDIILREEPPSPAEYGLNEESTKLEVLTEFVEAPVPVIKEKTIGDALTPNDKDETLGFGTITIGAGIAFSIGDETTLTNAPFIGGQKAAQVPVGKDWTQMEGRDFLIESVNYKSLKPHLQDLPKPEARLVPDDSARNSATKERKLPVMREARVTSDTIQLASVSQDTPGFLIDYAAVIGSTNYTFKGDTTYYVSGNVNLYGTTTLEGGTVIKFSPTNNAGISSMNGLFDCKTDSYRPAVFTARDDTTVGEAIGTNTVPIAYLSCFAFKGGTSLLSNVRFSHSSWPCSFWAGSSGGEIRDAQFVNCAIPINSEGKTIRLRNVLMTQSQAPLRGNSTYKIHAENVTIDSASSYLGGPGAGSIYFTNSIVTAITNLGAASVSTNNSVISAYPIPGIFQAVGAASYYLATNSVYRNIGTTNINTNLLAGLRKKTTCPPIVLTNNFTNDTTLFPQAQRDTDIPDLGYHYDPLDYCIGDARNISGATLTLTNGVAIGLYNSEGGFLLPYCALNIDCGGKLISGGDPLNLNRLVWYNTVQEQTTTNFVGPSWMESIAYWGTYACASSEIRCRFTDFSRLAGSGAHLGWGDVGFPGTILLKDSQFRGGSVIFASPPSGIWPLTVGVTNCVFERSGVVCFEGGASLTVDAYNNLFYQGSVTLDDGDLANGFAALTFKDNFFYTNTITQTTNVTVTHGYNGYLTNANRLTPTNANDNILTNFTFQVGALGNFYQPTDSLLLDVGSRNSTNAGLYHFTTTTNQVKETNSIVDIGFHYVALNEAGQPIDTDWDGIPDYSEDINGDGEYNSELGETQWYLPFTVNLTSPINGSYFAEPANISIQASTAGGNRPVSSIKFLRDQALLNSAAANPYQLSWPLVGAGQYSLVAVAYDINGLACTSAPVIITVTNLCTNP